MSAAPAVAPRLGALDLREPRSIMYASGADAPLQTKHRIISSCAEQIDDIRIVRTSEVFVRALSNLFVLRFFPLSIAEPVGHVHSSDTVAANVSG
eukprot:SAG31_NODE_18591_length_630_cov_1.073446_1_plen_94_part_01